MEYDSFLTILLGGFTIFWYIRMFIHTVAMVFILNFGGGSLNSSILLFFATLSGFLYVLISTLFYPHTNKFYQISISLAFASLLLSLVPSPILSLTFAVIFQIAVTPFLISVLLLLKKRFAVAAGLGILINIFVLSITSFSSLYTSFATRVLHIFLVFLWLVSVLFVVGRHIMQVYETTEISSTSAMVGFLGIFAILLGYPNVLAAWNQSSIFLITLLSVISIIGSIYLLIEENEILIKFEDYIPLVYIIGLLGIIFLNIDFLYYLAVLITPGAAIILLSYATRVKEGGTIKMLGIRMGAVQLLVLVLTFMQIATPFWTGMPVPLQPLLMETTRTLTLFLGLILPISGGWTYIRRDA